MWFPQDSLYCKLGFINDPLPPFMTKVLNFALYFFEGIPKAGVNATIHNDISVLCMGNYANSDFNRKLSYHSNIGNYGSFPDNFDLGETFLLL